MKQNILNKYKFKKPFKKPFKKSLCRSIKKQSKMPYHAQKTFTLYYSTMWGAWIIDYYMDKSFPLDGWIKPCYFCNSITGNYIKYDHRKKAVIIFPLCKHCVKNSFSSLQEIYKEIKLQLKDYTFNFLQKKLLL